MMTYLKMWVTGMFLLGITLPVFAQNPTIHLEEAIKIAENNYAGLERDRLKIQRYSKLAEAGLPQQATQLYISGEEFGSNGQSGVHSFNIQQNFYLPGAAEATRAYHRQGAVLAEKEFNLTKQELKRNVSLAFYQVIYTKEALELENENVELYNEFLQITSAHLETGETGKLPQVAAQTRLAQAKLEQNLAGESYQIARSLFNEWILSDTFYEAEGRLHLPIELMPDTILSSHPQLEIIQARKNISESKIETEEARLLPQINSGFKLQNAFGTFPLFGYQLGVNVPLFRKSYKTRIDAIEIEVMEQDAALNAERQKLKRTVSLLRRRYEKQRSMLEYLQNELKPLVKDQSDINLIAFREGETSYLEYLNSLEQEVQVKYQYLEALYKFNVIAVELDYWTGQ